MMNALYILDDSPWFEWIRLQATESTNKFVKHYRPVSPKDMVLVSADFQTEGRGQAGNSWESEEGQNLLFSLLLHPRDVAADRQFVLSQAMALAVCETLSGYAGEGVSIKWPNDIYWNDRKICGTLIENTLSGKNIEDCIIGVGVNVNQTDFKSDAPNPVSLRQLLGRPVSREAVMNRLLARFARYYAALQRGGEAERLHRAYGERLYWRDGRLHDFADARGAFRARLDGVEPDGRLRLTDASGVTRHYAFKEIRYVLCS